jgi:hypothetical protein
MYNSDNLRVAKHISATLPLPPTMVVKVVQCERDETQQGETCTRMCGLIDVERYTSEYTEVTNLRTRVDTCLQNLEDSYSSLYKSLDGRQDLRSALAKPAGDVCTPPHLDLEDNEKLNFSDAFECDRKLQAHMHELMCVLCHLCVRIDAFRSCVNYLQVPCTPDPNKPAKPDKPSKPTATQNHAKAE